MHTIGLPVSCSHTNFYSQSNFLYFLLFIWPLFSELIETWEETEWECGGLTHSEGPQAGPRTQGRCSKDQASVHASSTNWAKQRPRSNFQTIKMFKVLISDIWIDIICMQTVAKVLTFFMEMSKGVFLQKPWFKRGMHSQLLLSSRQCNILNCRNQMRLPTKDVHLHLLPTGTNAYFGLLAGMVS